MYLSKASTYGICSVAYLASKDEKAVISVRELSNELNIPAAFLTKIMQRLASRNIVVTMRGFGGGISLGKPASQITLKDVITAIDGEESFPYFWLGIPDEQLRLMPHFHKKWVNLIDEIDSFFSDTSLTELTPGDSEENSISMDMDNAAFPEAVSSNNKAKNISLD